jgi:hypothetical protein
MLYLDSRTNWANGACGRHARHESTGMRLVTLASDPRQSTKQNSEGISTVVGFFEEPFQEKSSVDLTFLFRLSLPTRLALLLHEFATNAAEYGA